MVLLIIPKHLKFGLIWTKDIVSDVMWFGLRFFVMALSIAPSDLGVKLLLGDCGTMLTPI